MSIPIGGFVYTIGYKKAAGREMLPNSGFWLQLPGFVAVRSVTLLYFYFIPFRHSVLK